MAETSKKQSNPYSTGGGGTNFETRVQAAFTVLMLSGRVAPCLPAFPIIKLKLQARYAGFHTDDFIVFTKQSQTGKEVKLLAQIKHDISITPSNETFAEVIQSAWNDFNGKIFNCDTDAFALITGPLSATDINDVRPLLEWARSSEDEGEFLTKINTLKFCSKQKRDKLEAFKTHLKTANGGTEVTDHQLWKFLKVFHLISYDLDTESGSTLSLLLSLISQYSSETPQLLWARVIDAVQTFNQNAGTISLETLPEDIRAAFNTVKSSDWLMDVKKFNDHTAYILGAIRKTVGKTHIKRPEIDQLLNLVESANFVFISGERGVGKSSLAQTFSEHLGERTPIFCLRTEDLEHSHLDKVFSAIGLRGSLSDLEAGFALMPKKYLIIESLEKLLELGNTAAFTDLLHLLNQQQSWTVIATGRNYAYQQISFTYLQPNGVKFATLPLEGFSDDQLQSLCKQQETLQKISGNSTLKPLLWSPFFAELAYRILETGTEFTPQDGEKEFRLAVWRDVIAKEQERKNGMPLKRRQTFVDIAVKRAKEMVYGVLAKGFDGDAVLKLEEDNLIHRDLKKNLVSPAHDVLEDWAIEEYIEEKYREYSDSTQNFLNAVGQEPAMNRAFRLWLHQRLREGNDVSELICSILDDKTIQRPWRDEAIAAVLLGDNPDEFLHSLKTQLFLDDGELLKRFCFILRIACQTPDEEIITQLLGDNILLLKPYGHGWQAFIVFLLHNKESISKSLWPHITAVLNDWATLLHVDKESSPPAREAGLLALYLLHPLKDSHKNKRDRKKLLSIIIRTASVISEEFIKLLETDVFITKVGKRQHRLHYVDDFCEMLFSRIESTFLCKYHPDILIRLAHFEWFIREFSDNEDSWYRNVEVAECFGLHRYKYDFFPASGEKGPFRNLLAYHPRKGLDFILGILNKAANNYAHSNLDHIANLDRLTDFLTDSDNPTNHDYLKVGSPQPLVEQIEIQLNDGSTVKQYCSERLWSAYRGHSTVPYLLQCALMALENWLIAYSEYSESNKLGWLFDYILRNSNSVMPTAVLASVATGFPQKVGRFVLPLLRAPKLYLMDLHRTIREQGKYEIDWFSSGYQRDPLSKFYIQERRTAALRPWRKAHLESLVMRLQFSEWRNEALVAIDAMRASVTSSDEAIRFLLHRIDSRDWNPVEDAENNRILFEPKNLEPDLKEIQQETQEQKQLNDRFTALCLWAKHIFAHEPLERNYYETWDKALSEAKGLFEELKVGTVSDLSSMFYGGIVTTAAVFMRDHSHELTEEEVSWCAKLIIATVMKDANSNDLLIVADKSDHDGAVATASVLPILLDFASEDDRLKIKYLIATALTHVNQNVRHGIAEGIRQHLWQRDEEFAQNCIMGTIAYARLSSFSLRDDNKQIKLQAQTEEFRDQLTRGQFLNEPNQITLQTHDSWYILAPCLMIPDDSTKPEHVSLFSQMLTLCFKSEQEEYNPPSERNELVKIHHETVLKFTRRFAEYLFHSHEPTVQNYIQLLRVGCDIAPSFMSYLLLCIAVESEKTGKKGSYWQFFQAFSQKVQKIAIEMRPHDDDRPHDKKRELIRRMLKADLDWREIDSENQDIAYGKDLILEFVRNAGTNPTVFESLARLIYYFPSIFFESGIPILSKIQKEEGGIRLLSDKNTAFYLEEAIRRFLQLTQTGPLSKKMHESCFILLNAIVETASSRGYYLREYLVRSRKVL
ncbi:MAG: ATP-binding protein [Thiotrichaceae bacterium IS1]|nr:MAG: ATP-binding protein [Thiotrichaceae bacterium IS1]